MPPFCPLLGGNRNLDALRDQSAQAGFSPALLPRISLLPLPPAKYHQGESACKATSLGGRGQSDPRIPFQSSGYFAALTLAASRRTQHFFLWAHPVLVILNPGLIVF